MNKTHDNGSEFLSLLKTLWEGKYIIVAISIFTCLVGVYYSINKPKSYEISTTIEHGKPSAFINFIPINYVLTDNEIYLSDEDLDAYLISSSSIFEMFVSEFNDYEEMMIVLSKVNSIKKSIKDLSQNDKRKILIKHAKSFVLSQQLANPPSLEKKAYLTLNWHNPAEGSRILNEAILLTLTNVKKNLINNINKLAMSIDTKKERDLEIIRDQINSIEQTQALRMLVRVKYLKEHSVIAKELNIEKNTLDANALGKSKIQSKFQNLLLPPPNVELSLNKMNDFPYYLRGFKAIDKEISLIKNRSKNEQLLLADDYVDIQEEFLKIKNNSSSSQLRNFAKNIENNNARNWIQFNLLLGNTKSHNKQLLYVALSIILGLLIGSMYVVLSKIIRKL